MDENEKEKEFPAENEEEEEIPVEEVIAEVSPSPTPAPRPAPEKEADVEDENSSKKKNENGIEEREVQVGKGIYSINQTVDYKEYKEPPKPVERDESEESEPDIPGTSSKKRGGGGDGDSDIEAGPSNADDDDVAGPSEKAEKDEGATEGDVEGKVFDDDDDDDDSEQQDFSSSEESEDLGLWEIDEEKLALENGKLDTDEFMKHLKNTYRVVSKFAEQQCPELRTDDGGPEITKRKINQFGEIEKDNVGDGFEFKTLSMDEIIAAKNSPKLLANLLKADPDLANRKDFCWGYSTLHWATKSNNIRNIKMLIKAKADPCAQSHGGTTPLHIAAMNNHTDAMQLLLEAGANLEIRSNSGLKARDVAKGNARFVLQNRLKCYDYDIIKSILPNSGY